LNGSEIRRHAVKFSSDQQVDRLLALEGGIGMAQIAPNGFVIRERLFKQGNNLKKPFQFSGPTGACSFEPTMRRSSRDVQDSAENLLRYSQEPDDLREAARPAMPSSFECAQAVQMFEQGRGLHFGIKEHQYRRWPRLTKNFYNLFSIDLGHANIHQNDVRPFLPHLFKIFQGSDRPYFSEASEDSLGRWVRTLLFQGDCPYRHTTSSRTDILTVRVDGCDGSVKTVSGHKQRSGSEPNFRQVGPESEGVSLNPLINLAIAEKISALRTEEFFRERGAHANIKKARKILNRTGKEPPRKGDEIP